jgi:hypothetical protein
LRAAKANGKRLGNPNLRSGTKEHAIAASQTASRVAQRRRDDILPYLRAARKAGANTLVQLATALEARGIRAPRGGSKWSPSQVRRLLPLI